MSTLSFRGLTLFSRTNSPWLFNLASYHDPRSLTWSWCVSFSFFRRDERRIWPLVWVSRWNPRAGLRLPFVGALTWSWQAKMLRKGCA